MGVCGNMVWLVGVFASYRVLDLEIDVRVVSRKPDNLE